MNTKYFFIIILSLIILFVGCDITKESSPKQSNMEDMDVPAIFDYKTITDVDINITLLDENDHYLNGMVVSVYADTFLTDDKLISKGQTKSKGVFATSLSLPQTIHRLTFSCVLGQKTLEIESGAVNYIFNESKKYIKSNNFYTLSSKGLLAAWKFDYGSGTIAYDDVGDNDGDIINATWTEGCVGSALEFNGDDAWVRVPEQPIFDLENQLTYMAWVKPYAHGTTRVAQKGDGDGYGIYMDIWRGWECSITLSDDPGANIDWQEGRPDLNKWYHVAMTYDNSQLKLYIDGELKNSTDITGDLKNNDRDVSFGSDVGSQKFFEGIIDEIYLYNNPLSAAEIEDYYINSKPVLSQAAKWSFNTGSGDIAYDEFGDNDGTIEGATWTSGVSGSALSFDGEDDYVDIGTFNSDLDPIVSDKGSIEFWANIGESADKQYLFHSLDQSENTEIEVYYSESDQIRFVFHDWEHRVLLTTASSGVEADDGVWHYFVMTWDQTEGEMKAYIDGEQVGYTVDISGLNWDPTFDVTLLGGDGSYLSTHGFSVRNLNGRLDEIAIYDECLIATEINQLYNSQNNPDTDGDGVHDDEDDYPEDASRAFNDYYPDKNSFGTIAFEDNWPAKGDYDFNDLVIDYNFNQISDADNMLVEVEGMLKLMAIGAGYHNGFYFQLPFTADKIASFDNGGNDFMEFETGTTNAVLQIFTDAFDLMQPPADASGSWINTVQGEEYVTPVELDFSFTLSEPVDPDGFEFLPPYNPFLTVNGDRGREVHLANYPPTSLVTDSLYGTKDDDSNPTEDRYYKTANNLPWAVLVPQNWSYTTEESQITWAYLVFRNWAESAGSSYQDWYDATKSDYVDFDFIYQP